jgi:hypothetical protein
MTTPQPLSIDPRNSGHEKTLSSERVIFEAVAGRWFYRLLYCQDVNAATQSQNYRPPGASRIENDRGGLTAAPVPHFMPATT